MAVRDLGSLIAQMEEDQSILRIARNPLAQFGTDEVPLLGAGILPEQTVETNSYREEKVQYRTVIANHGTRYSPIQIKGSAMTGWVDVTLWHSDKGDMMTSRDFDALLSYLRRRSDMEAIASLTKFVDRGLVVPLKHRNEKDRWDAIVNAQVVLLGDNGYTETINFLNPAGHRAAAGGTWSNDAYDPFLDLYTMQQMLAAKGLKLKRLISSYNVVSIMSANAKVAARTNRITIISGTVTAQEANVRLPEINQALTRDGLPPIELFDAQYRTQTGTARFMPNNVVVGVCETGRDAELDLGDRIVILPNTLGYTAIGTPAGQSTPGTAMVVEHFRTKPPRIDGQIWQAAGVVITEPEGLIVISGIA